MNPQKAKHITVLGDGAWGTTLAIHLAKKGYDVKLWGPFPGYLKILEKKRCNIKFLPGIRIPHSITFVTELPHALKEAEIIIFAIPSKFLRNLLKEIKKIPLDLSKKSFLSVIKGLETKSLLRMSRMIEQELHLRDVAVLSGPNIAIEIAKGIPSSAVIACKNQKKVQLFQKTFNTPTFRIYTNSDVPGVELGGSLKNIIAIACGICDGLGFGTNTKAALLTRGLTEMARLGKILGAKEKTFFGLSGLGDLMTTAFSQQSRNRYVGEQLGKGKGIEEILASMSSVAEGVETVKAVYRLSLRHHVPMPITKEVHNILYKKKSAQKVVQDLMNRKLSSE